MRRALPFVPLLLAGCGKGNFSQASSVPSDTLVYPLQAKNTTLDPGKVNDAYMAEVLQNVVEPLVIYNETNEIVPCLAQRWELSEGGKTYLFHLRKGVRFTNGRPLVADDFRRSWERYLAPGFASPAAGNYLLNIQGVAEYVAGRAKAISGVKAIDAETLSVTLDKPRPFFLGNLTVPTAAVMDCETAGEKEATTIDKIIGTGAYKLAKLIPDAELDLDANAEYWGGKPKVAHIRRPIITDPSARLSRFLSGDLDYLELDRQSAQTLERAKAEAGHLRYVPKPWLQFLVLGEKAYPAFRDGRVRQALAMGIDRSRLVGQLLAGYDEAKGLVPHGVPGFQDDYKGLTFDPVRARALLAEAGFPEGRGLPPIELDYTTTLAENRVIAESVATDLHKNLGVVVKPMLIEWGAYLDKQDRGKLAMGTVGWSADYLDPQNFISMQVASFGPQDKEGFQDAQVDAMCLQADSDPDPNTRSALYKRAERRAVELAARIPIFMMNQPILTSSRVKRLPINAIGVMPIVNAEMGK